MKLSDSPPPARPDPWISLWVAAFVSLLAQLWLCQFFSFGNLVPLSLDVNPSNLWELAYHFPPTGSFQILNWLGVPLLPPALNPVSFASAHLPPWWFLTTYAPIMATLALLAMAAFLRELELSRPAALFGAVIYAWQGDILPFVYPGHYAYIGTWPFFAIAAWGALRVQRTGHWAYAVMSGAGCGLMVGLQPDRGGIASLLVAVLYLTPIFSQPLSRLVLMEYLVNLRRFALCVAVAMIVALAPLLALFQGNIVGVKLGGETNTEQTFKYVTQFSLGPAETLTYLAPGFFGWHVYNNDGPYWGWIGEWPDWPKNHQGTLNLNLAISTTGTVATVLALIGIVLLLPGSLLGPGGLTARQRIYGRVVLGFGLLALILAWGWHTPLYRPLFDYLPLMDKWRNPLKWLEMTNFAMVMLSAIGVQHLVTSLDADAPDTKIIRSRLAWFTLVIFILLGLGLGASYPLAILLAARLQSEVSDPPAIANMMSTMHVSLLWALILMGLVCLLLRAFWRPDMLRGITLVNPLLHRLWQRMLRPNHLPLTLVLGLAVLAAMQLGWVATQFLQPWPIKALTDSNPLLEALRSEGDTVRVSVATTDPLLNTLLENQFIAMNIPCIDISAASRIPDDLNAFFQALNDNHSRLWFLAGVKDVVVPQQLLPQMRQDPGVAANVAFADGYVLEQTDSPDVPSHALVGMKDFLAKVTLVPQAEFFSTDEEVLTRLRDQSWNPRESVLLASKDRTSADADKSADPDVPNHVDLMTYTPTEIKIDAQSVEGGYLLINDRYDPDWEVQIDGHAAPLLCADYIMRAVQIPPGDSTVTMQYVSRYHIGEIIRQMTRLNVGDFSPTTQTVNNLSDGAMLASWLIAGVALLVAGIGADDKERRNRARKSADPQATKL